MDRHTFKEKFHVSLGIGIISGVVMLGELALGLFQIFNGIISIWNLAPLGMIAFIIFLNIGLNKGKIKESNEEIAVVDQEHQQMDSNTIIDTNVRISGKQILLRVAFMTLFVLVAIIFFAVAQNNATKYNNVVVANIVSQETYTSYVSQRGSDGIEVAETRYGVVFFEYEYNGERKVGNMSYNMGNARAKNIEICVNNDGEFLKSYDSVVRIYYVEAIVFAVAGILMMLSLMFLMPMEFMFFDVMSLIGASLMFMTNSPFLANLIYIDITTFLAFFFFIGLFGMIGTSLFKIFDK